MRTPTRPTIPAPTRRAERVIGLTCIIIVGLATLTLSGRITRATKNALGTDSVLGKVNEQLNPFRTRQALLDCGLPVYDLSIKPSEYRSILQVVADAKRRGFLSDDLKQWTQAKFLRDGHSRNVKLRVRGDGANHWAEQRKSWRIRFPKDDPLDGMQEINLIVMSDGKSITEPFTNRVFGRMGMMTLRDGYVVLRINGVPQGVYYLTEHWDAPLLAHQQRPETTIFRNPRGGRDLGCFEEQVTQNDPAGWPALQVLLNHETHPTPENFRAALAVTDVDDYLRFTAGTTIFCADHTSLVTDNHRLYYDTSRGKFSRIPWDLEPQRIPPIERFDLADWHSTFDVFARWPMSRFRISVLQDDQLRLRRNRLLWGCARDDSLLRLFDEVYAGIDLAFWADVTGNGTEEDRLTTFRGVVQHNLKVIRRSLVRSQTELTIHQEDPLQTRLSFAVDNAAGIVLHGLHIADTVPDTLFALHRDENRNGILDPADLLVTQARTDDQGQLTLGPLSEHLASHVGLVEDHPAYLFQSQATDSRYKTEPLRTVIYPKTARYDYFLVRNLPPHTEPTVWPTLTVEASNAVTDAPLTDQDLFIRILDRSLATDLLARSNSRELFLAAHPTFTASTNESGWSSVVLRPGTHSIQGTVALPLGVGLDIEPGARIEMGSGANLLCFAPIHANGTPEAPIEIVPAGEMPWGVVAAVDPGAESTFKHVYLAGGGSLDGITVQGIFFTAALAVHHGDVSMEHCRVTHCPAEDGVNIKNGRVTIRDSYFADNASDAVDLDFVSGSVAGCHFAGNRGDALDFSGSTAEVANCRMERSVDKGISVGEASKVSVRDTLLLENAIGLAVKDGSEARIEYCTLMANATALAAYRKKPVFGGAVATASACILLDNREVMSLDGLSRIEFSDCIGPAQPTVTGVAAADGDWPSLLRSQNFVAHLDAGLGTHDRSRQTKDRKPPGIVAEPVDLR